MKDLKITSTSTPKSPGIYQSKSVEAFMTVTLYYAVSLRTGASNGGARAKSLTRLQLRSSHTDTVEVADAPMPLSARDGTQSMLFPAGYCTSHCSTRAEFGCAFLSGWKKQSCRSFASCRYFLDDVTVSRKHCQFLSRDGGHTVRDSGSLNGTMSIGNVLNG